MALAGSGGWEQWAGAGGRARDGRRASVGGGREGGCEPAEGEVFAGRVGGYFERRERGSAAAWSAPAADDAMRLVVERSRQVIVEKNRYLTTFGDLPLPVLLLLLHHAGRVIRPAAAETAKTMIRVTEAVFFDAAGTLIEVAEPGGVTYARMAAEHGVTGEPAPIDQASRAPRDLPPPLEPLPRSFRCPCPPRRRARRRPGLYLRRRRPSRG